jgi:hypothetical protein
MTALGIVVLVVIFAAAVTAFVNYRSRLVARRQRIERTLMEIDKQQIVSMLRDRGDHDKADQAEQQLPDKVDHEEHGGLLGQFGVNPQDLLGRLG